MIIFTNKAKAGQRYQLTDIIGGGERYGTLRRAYRIGEEVWIEFEDDAGGTFEVEVLPPAPAPPVLTDDDK